MVTRVRRQRGTVVPSLTVSFAALSRFERLFVALLHQLPPQGHRHFFVHLLQSRILCIVRAGHCQADGRIFRPATDGDARCALFHAVIRIWTAPPASPALKRIGRRHQGKPDVIRMLKKEDVPGMVRWSTPAAVRSTSSSASCFLNAWTGAMEAEPARRSTPPPPTTPPCAPSSSPAPAARLLRRGGR